MLKSAALGRIVLCLSLGCAFLGEAAADQIICVSASAFDKSLSQLTAVKGNQWKQVADAASLTGTAMTGPGDNNFAAELADGPFLIYKLPVNVAAAEATAGGKKWQVWFHMRVPTDRNSFYWQFGTDLKTWKPSPTTNANRVNDDAMINTNKWYWQDQLTGNDGAATPELAAGTNYLRVAVRESDNEPNAPLFDCVCVRNFGTLGQANAPKDADVKALLATTPVEPLGKLTTTWANLRETP